jgi:septal ring factor EnvC (AmiA/AmiB activator)
VGRSLYEITAELDVMRDKAYAYAEEHDGEIPDYILDFLESLEGEQEEKAVNIACVYKDILSYIDAVKKEQQRLSKMRKSYENEADRIKNYLSAFLNEGQKIKTDRAVISWRKTTHVELLDGVVVEELPLQYQKVEVNPIKSLLKKDINDGVDDAIKYAQIVTSKNITIK